VTVPLYEVGKTGLRILRRDKTVITYPPGHFVFFKQLPARFEGELTRVRIDPKHGQYENKALQPAENKDAAPRGRKERTPPPEQPIVMVPEDEDDDAPKQGDGLGALGGWAED
jgi:hypothetical protein